MTRLSNGSNTRVDGHANCIGSDCMMWRWKYVFNDDPIGVDDTVKSDTDGHCGLAGKP